MTPSSFKITDATWDTEPAASAAAEFAGGPLRKLSVLMPIYNEYWTLAKIVGRVLNAPLPIERELVAVDDCSQDGSWEILQQLAANDSRIRIFRHEKNCGKGAAIRTAIREMTGDVAVVQDADLEYDPCELPSLLEPLLQGKADAVFGSRFAGPPRRVLYYWHTLGNRVLTLLSNMINDMNLTDMETCYKMIRADVLQSLRLTSNTFTFEPELTCRLGQWGARIYEVPISYSGRTYLEGKKIRGRDALKALGTMLHRRFIDTRFTYHEGFCTLTSMARANRYNHWILDQVKPYLGQRLLEAGAGIGNLSHLLVKRQRLLLVENESLYVSFLQQRFGQRDNVRVDAGDLTRADHFARWQGEQLDTVFCANVLERVEKDDDVLRRFCDLLVPGGHCVIVVPAGQWLYTSMDAGIGRYRRYTVDVLRQRMTEAGFEVAFHKQFSRLGALGWAFAGHLLKRRNINPRQMILFDRLLPLAKVLEHVLPVPGMSLIMVGRKPQRAAQRKAA
jgi:glycosyltransferase involved in cell wall biosynthesis